jgi:hypothetical protein
MERVAVQEVEVLHMVGLGLKVAAVVLVVILVEVVFEGLHYVVFVDLMAATVELTVVEVEGHKLGLVGLVA